MHRMVRRAVPRPPLYPKHTHTMEVAQVAKYVKNPAGAVHSVPDDFEAPAEWGKKGESWFEVLEDEARKLAGVLFGAKDPAVEQARLTDERAADPEDTGIPAPSEPQPVDADGNLIPVPTDHGDPNVPAPVPAPDAEAAPAPDGGDAA